MKAMGNPILGLLRVRSDPGQKMLNLRSAASCRIFGTTVVDVDVSSQVCAVEIAHHRGAVIVGCELMSIHFESGIFRPFN